jgi:hypothetical protein
MQDDLSGNIKNFVTKLPGTAWIFVLMLSITPLLVGFTEAMLRDWPEVNPLLGNLTSSFNLWSAVILLPVSSALVLGVVGWFLMFIPTIAWFQARPLLIKVIVLGIALSLTLAILWTAITWIFLVILFEPYYGPMLGWPVIPAWINTVGWIWTCGIIFFVIIYCNQQSAQYSERV